MPRLKTTWCLVWVLAGWGCGSESDSHPRNASHDAGPDVVHADAAVDATDDLVDGPVTLTTAGMFAGGVGSLCGIGYDPVDDQVWVYPCSSDTFHGFSPAGAPVGTLARPGEAANDADLDFAPAALTLGTSAVTASALLFTNGEIDVAEIYLPETTATAALVSAFGASHVVGASYHTGRTSLFAVQDHNAGTEGNLIAEIDPVSGAVLGSFSTLPAFDVDYGDLDVCQSSGHLFVVSSVEPTLAELTPTGTLVAEYPLPVEVTLASGIGIDDASGVAWISGTGGGVWQIQGLPCAP